jgi:hypothetical protein
VDRATVGCEIKFILLYILTLLYLPLFYMHAIVPFARSFLVLQATFSQAHAALVSKYGHAAVDVHTGELQSAFAALKAEAAMSAAAVKTERPVKKMVEGRSFVARRREATFSLKAVPAVPLSPKSNHSHLPLHFFFPQSRARCWRRSSKMR